MKLNIEEIDVFYISYDEPNAEKNWADLLGKVTWAKRIHGVYGSDSAHKAAAEESKTDRFITVDGDNIVREQFFNGILDFQSDYEYENTIYSWCSYNIVNGLVYGNGGIKCWPKRIVQEMKTHENAEAEEDAIDFCWNKNYKNHPHEVYSESHINGSPLQAFRSGFREGVKMSLNRGKRFDILEFKKNCYWENLDRLLIWCNIGSDVENGLWSMFGARLGVLYTFRDWDYTQVRDFEYINKLFKTFEKSFEKTLQEEVIKIGQELIDKFNLNMINPDPEYSKFFKQVYINPGMIKCRTD